MKRLRNYRTAYLVLGGALLLASGCGDKAPVRIAYPPAADLRGEPKPLLDPAAIDSEAALDQHEIGLEAWGERGWSAVARLCRWAVDLGMPDPGCAPAPGVGPGNRPQP